MSNKSLVSLAAICTLAIPAVMFNPTADKHRETIQEVLAGRSQFNRCLGVGTLTAFMSNSHSVGVASYTIVNDKVASIGMFGMVFVTE